MTSLIQTGPIQTIIEAAWDARDGIGPSTTGEVRDAVAEALALLDSGHARVAEPGAQGWQVNQWLKKAVLLSFRLNDNQIMEGPGNSNWWDKVPSKFDGWGENRFREAGFRAVPGCVVRAGAHIGRNVVLMPSFVNIGAYVGDNSMGDRGQLRPDWQECASVRRRWHWRRARTVAGQSCCHRR
jgi:2,3,4,5-tetrahydropyridine-2,6-dicarboxylate N-succinyltransferase